MEPEMPININSEEINRMSIEDQKAMAEFANMEQQKMRLQSTVHQLTETCFKKCITGSISAGKLAGKEQSCMQNCVERFMDSNLAMLKHLEKLRSQQ